MKRFVLTLAAVVLGVIIAPAIIAPSVTKAPAFMVGNISVAPATLASFGTAEATGSTNPGTLGGGKATTKMSVVDVLVVGPDGNVGDDEQLIGDMVAGELMYRYPRGGMPVVVYVKVKTFTDAAITGSFRGVSAGRLVFAGPFSADNTKSVEEISDDLGGDIDGWVPTQLKNQAPKPAGGGQGARYSAKHGRVDTPGAVHTARKAPKPARIAKKK